MDLRVILSPLVRLMLPSLEIVDPSKPKDTTASKTKLLEVTAKLFTIEVKKVPLPDPSSTGRFLTLEEI